MSTQFSRVLIVRRGQAAIRVARTCKRLGITAVAVRSSTSTLLHLEACDVSLEVTDEEGRLDIGQLVEKAVADEIDAVHPGFGRFHQRAELARAVEAIGEPEKGAILRAKQLWHWIYHHGVDDFSHMTSLNGALRDALAASYTLERPKITREQKSQDGTRKWLLRFADGQEAEFLHSDVAAVRKPKWYLLGTKGAIVGHWNEATLLEPDPITYFREQHVPTTEIVPLLSLYQRHPLGNAVAQQLSLPARRPLPFHLSLADHLLTGEPLSVTPQSAARVVAVLEAASRSAERGGAPETLCV